jgi:flagellar biosynthesis protein FlhA
MSGQPAVLLVSPSLRPVLARFLRSTVPQMHVIAWNEVPDSRKVRLVNTIGT